jgi:hypothetical protein
MRNKLKLSSDSANSGSKNCKKGYGGAYSGVWWSLESGGRFCGWCVWQESGFGRCEDLFTFNLLYNEIL